MATIAPGRDRSIARRHPWIFSGAIASVAGDPGSGDIVRIDDDAGRFRAWASFSPQSRIRARVWSWAPADRIDASFIEGRLEAAIRRRYPHGIAIGDGRAARLVNAEADGLPGLVVDRYADVLVVQVLSAGAERWRAAIVEALVRQTGCRAIHERSDAEVRTLEGLEPRTGALHGPPVTEIEVVEPAGGASCRYAVDVAHGHKTGFYLDQSANRARIGALAAGGEMLNCFCYTGGFSVAAAMQGARRVVSVDSSADALALARRNAALNGLADPLEWIEDDVFRSLRNLRDAAARFDVIVLDPPKFAPTAQSVERAARAYKDINLVAFALLKPGGVLATFSCSGAIERALFQSIVAGAAEDAGVEVEIVDRLGAAPDHPVVLAFPEGDYLKGLLLRRRA